MRYAIDGTTKHGDLASGTGDAPFYIFDIEAQDWLPESYGTRASAEEALVNIINERASVQGWAIFGTHRGWELERDDSMGAFAGDGEAWRFVRETADSENGVNEPARDALAFLKQYQPDECARVMGEAEKAHR